MAKDNARWEGLVGDELKFSSAIGGIVDEQYEQLVGNFEHWMALMDNRQARHNYLSARFPNATKRALKQGKGMYTGLEFTLDACMHLHEKRWAKLQQELSNATRGTFVEFSKKCFTLSQVVIAMVVLKCRVVFGHVPDDFKALINKLSIASINPKINWDNTLDSLYRNSIDAKIPLGACLQTVFRRYARVILTAMDKNDKVFEFPQPFLKDLNATASLEEAKARLESYPPKQLRAMSLGLVGGKSLVDTAALPDDSLTLTSLGVIQDIEANVLDDIQALLLQVQLTARCWMSWEESGGGALYLDEEELVTRYANMQLVCVKQVTSRSDQVDLFQYPLSLYPDAKSNSAIYLTCEVFFPDAKTSYFPQLELPVAFYMFGHQHQRLLADALFRTMVTHEMRGFLQARETVELQDGSVIPKHWLDRPAFADVV